MFNPIEFNINWDFLAILVAILTGIFGFYKRIWLKTKEIRLSEIIFRSFINKPSEHENDIKVFYKDVEIESFNSICIYLNNSGNHTLNVDDYFIQPTLEVKGFTRIWNIIVSTSNEFTCVSSQKINDAKFELNISDFEPKDYIKIEVLFESIGNDFIPYFEFYLKREKKVLLNLNEYSEELRFGQWKDEKETFTVMAFVFSVVLGLTYLIVKFGLGVELSQKFEIGWKLLYYGPSSISATVTFFLWHNIINKFHWGWKSVQIWHNKANIKP